MPSSPVGKKSKSLPEHLKSKNLSRNALRERKNLVAKVLKDALYEMMHSKLDKNLDVLDNLFMAIQNNETTPFKRFWDQLPEFPHGENSAANGIARPDLNHKEPTHPVQPAKKNLAYHRKMLDAIHGRGNGPNGKMARPVPAAQKAQISKPYSDSGLENNDPNQGTSANLSHISYLQAGEKFPCKNPTSLGLDNLNLDCLKISNEDHQNVLDAESFLVADDVNILNQSAIQDQAAARTVQNQFNQPSQPVFPFMKKEKKIYFPPSNPTIDDYSLDYAESDEASLTFHHFETKVKGFENGNEIVQNDAAVPKTFNPKESKAVLKKGKKPENTVKKNLVQQVKEEEPKESVKKNLIKQVKESVQEGSPSKGPEESPSNEAIKKNLFKGAKESPLKDSITKSLFKESPLKESDNLKTNEAAKFSSPGKVSRRLPKKPFLTRAMKGQQQLSSASVSMADLSGSSSDVYFEANTSNPNADESFSGSIQNLSSYLNAEDCPEKVDDDFDLSSIDINVDFGDRLLATQMAQADKETPADADETFYFSFSEDLSISPIKRNNVEDVDEDFLEVPDNLALASRFNGKDNEDPNDESDLLNQSEDASGFGCFDNADVMTVENWEAGLEIPDAGFDFRKLNAFKSSPKLNDLESSPKMENDSSEDDFGGAFDGVRVDELDSPASPDRNPFRVNRVFSKPEMPVGLERLRNLQLHSIPDDDLDVLGVTGAESFHQKTKVWGDGSELDDILGFETDNNDGHFNMQRDNRRVKTSNSELTKKFARAIEGHVVIRAPKASSTAIKKMKTEQQQQKPKSEQKQGLIQCFSSITYAAKDSPSHMVFNKETGVWEGNEKDVRKFPVTESDDHHGNNNSARKHPALITNMTNGGDVKVENNMIFDPIKGRWVGNEDDTADWDFMEESETAEPAPFQPRNCTAEDFKIDIERLIRERNQCIQIKTATWYHFKEQEHVFRYINYAEPINEKKRGDWIRKYIVQ